MTFGRRPDEGVSGVALRYALLCTGLAAVVFGALAYVDLLGETPATELTQANLLFALVIGLPIVNALLTFVASADLLRRGATFYAQFYGVTLLIWIFAGTSQVDPHGEVWILSITAIPAASAMIGRPRPSTWTYLPFLALLVALVAIRTSTSPDAVWEGVLTGLYDASFSGLFVGMVYVALIWTRQLDEGLASEASAEAVARARAAQDRERLRYEALVHDAVISTLLVAARDAASPDVLAQQAESTLTQLADRSEEAAVSSDELAARIRRAVREIVPSTQWSADVGRELDLAPSVADALFGAATEAVRNVHRHAGSMQTLGREVDVIVNYRADERSVTVEITDTGSGFDIAKVAPTRMGIRRSIIDRMRAIGGSAQVSSTPNTGTCVTLDWTVSP